MRILLVCAAGMSTSLLVNNMRKVADQDDLIEAYPVADLSKHVQDFDIILVGPQVRYKMKDIEAVALKNGKVAALMDMMAYGKMDGEVMYKQAQDLLKR